jgi:hypothetical protein
VQIVRDFGLYTKRVCTKAVFCTCVVRANQGCKPMKKASTVAGLV